jgi:hypothetical protein
VSGFESFLDEREKSASGLAWDHIEGDEVIVCANEVLVVRIEDTKVVVAAVIGAVCNFFESASGEPSIDLGSTYWDDVEARLRSDDGEFAIGLMDDPFELIECGNKKVLEVDAL